MVRKIILNFEKEFFSKLAKKSKKLGFKSPEDYLYELARRNVYSKTNSNTSTTGDIWMDIFSRATKQSRKKERLLKRQGVNRL